MNTDNRPSFETIERWLSSGNWRVRAAAMNACQGRKIPIGIIKRGLNDSDFDVRTAAINACQDRNVPLDIIELGLADKDWRVRVAAINACKGRDVPIEIIKQGLDDEDYDVRAAALNICLSRDISPEIIERRLKDNNLDVRMAAMNVYKARNIPIPVIRTMEPPELVYKKCLGGVIVVASIPHDAQVRGSFGHKCRASKAVIKTIIGDICGEQVGISGYDLKTFYYPGAEIEIDNFDPSDGECSSGFHFFCTIEEALSYCL